MPWHRDRAIAVEDARTRLSGVPHVDASEPVLREMLALRVHLDDAAEENGALSLVPGSHDDDRRGPADGLLVPAERGDVLAMRPLVLHASRASASGMPRRVLHLELAAHRDLARPHAWHRFLPLRS